jgi:hypothetical protein
MLAAKRHKRRKNFRKGKGVLIWAAWELTRILLFLIISAYVLRILRLFAANILLVNWPVESEW